MHLSYSYGHFLCFTDPCDGNPCPDKTTPVGIQTTCTPFANGSYGCSYPCQVNHKPINGDNSTDGCLSKNSNIFVPFINHYSKKR